MVIVLSGTNSFLLKKLSDIDAEASVGAWYSSMQFFCISVLSLVFCYHKIRKNLKAFPLIALPALFMMMSIDEATQIHEFLGEKSDVLFESGTRKGTSFEHTGIWMFVIGLPFMGLFLLFAYSIKKHLSDKPFSLLKLIGGMIIMLTGALGFELVSNYFVGNKYMFLVVVAEEGLEMVGATIMLWAIYDLAIDYILPPAARSRMDRTDN